MQRTWRRPVASALILGVLVASTSLAPVRASAAPAVPRNVEQYTGYYAERVLNRTYQTLFARTPGTSGRNYWLWRLVGHPDAVWFASTLMSSAEYRRGTLATASDTAFVKGVLRNTTRTEPATADVNGIVVDLKAGRYTRSRFVATVVERRYTPTLTTPNRAVVPCRTFTRPGPVATCTAGSTGDQRAIDVLQIPDTNIYVNRAWYPKAALFVAAARAAGYRLSGARDADTPAWMFSPGSWRSWDEQLYLYQHGYPANPPGKSMHEWGLAIDLDCNGEDITTQPGCWSWVRANGPARGVYLFRTVDQISDKEAWHVSSNSY